LATALNGVPEWTGQPEFVALKAVQALYIALIDRGEGNKLLRCHETGDDLTARCLFTPGLSSTQIAYRNYSVIVV
jgi:hypothetical protein